jgi:hypothetical protein
MGSGEINVVLGGSDWFCVGSVKDWVMDPENWLQKGFSTGFWNPSTALTE